MKLTEENRAKLNELVRMLRGGVVTKQEIMDVFDTNERTARDMVSEVAKRVPVISLSDAKGYRLATCAADIGDAMHAYNENTKRSAEIGKRNEPLRKFLEAYKAI